MAEEEFYDLVFKGELVKGADAASTKANIGKLFNVAPEKVDALFSGRAITLKKQLDFDSANRYRTAIKKAGARVDLVACQISAPQKESVLSSSGTRNATPDSASQVAAAATNNQEQERAALRPSGLSLRDQGGNLLDEGELKKAPPVEVDISSLSLAAAGEDLLRPNEKPKPKVVSVNTEKFSLEESSPDISPVG